MGDQALIRTVLKDRAVWERIAPLVPGKDGDPGRSGQDNRLFVEAVLWLVRAGAPWRDLPPQFGGEALRVLVLSAALAAAAAERARAPPKATRWPQPSRRPRAPLPRGRRALGRPSGGRGERLRARRRPRARRRGGSLRRARTCSRRRRRADRGRPRGGALPGRRRAPSSGRCRRSADPPTPGPTTPGRRPRATSFSPASTRPTHGGSRSAPAATGHSPGSRGCGLPPRRARRLAAPARRGAPALAPAGRPQRARPRRPPPVRWPARRASWMRARTSHCWSAGCSSSCAACARRPRRRVDRARRGAPLRAGASASSGRRG